VLKVGCCIEFGDQIGGYAGPVVTPGTSVSAGGLSTTCTLAVALLGILNKANTEDLIIILP
jgi:hypothetical protein